jgi:pyruvate dehydrogenase E2 component (dihydrolipoamide acetyltransferase)
VPGVNGHWRDGTFVPSQAVHLAVVVALHGGGLLAPVIHDAAGKSLDAFMGEMRDLVTRARTGRLRASEVTGATFTITQLGDGEVDEVTPIIHPPQVAILGLGAIHDEPWAQNGMLAARPVVHATLAGDHRAIDGRIGSAYLNALKRCLQESTTP